MAARRLFFALWPEAYWAEGLLEATHDAIAASGGRPVPCADLHVTLCFLGALEEAALAGVCERVNELRPADFELEFAALEYWPHARLLAATAAVAPTAALELARVLHGWARAAGSSTEELPLRPHVTLVRGVSTPGPSPHARPLLPPRRLQARRLHLAQSLVRGAGEASMAAPARYVRLQSWPLTGRG
ncbi:MAG TPA: RNA 2',3'-cyclic phosphodiesterase [Steroidobacteraceae bacterium]